LQGVGSSGGDGRGVKGRPVGGEHVERSSGARRFAAVECASAHGSALPFAGRAGTRASGRRAYVRGGSVPSSARGCDTRRTRGFEEGTRAPARAFARALEACVLWSASRRRRGACSSLLSRERSPHVCSPRLRWETGGGEPRGMLYNEIPRATTRGRGERTRARFDSSRDCAHASFVLQKSVGRRLTQRSAHPRVRGAKPLVRVRIRVNGSLANREEPASKRGGRAGSEERRSSRSGAILIT